MTASIFTAKISSKDQHALACLYDFHQIIVEILSNINGD